MVKDFLPDFTNGLLPVIAQEEATGEVLMLAWMNETAFKKTLETGFAHYWSRSRQKLWKKGEESGNLQKIISVRMDCDKDAILLLVEQQGGAACHTGHKSCFFQEWKQGIIADCSPLIFDPAKIYKKRQ